MEEDLEGYKILVEEFDKYLVQVRSSLINAHTDSVGTRHEVAAQTATNLMNDLYKRWYEAFSSVRGGEHYEFPSEITVEKEEPADEEQEQKPEPEEEYTKDE